MNRITGKSYNDSVTQWADFTYDQGGSSVNANGRLTTAHSGSVYYDRGYDALGRVTASSQCVGTHAWPMNYTYNLVGELTQFIFPSGRIQSNTFDTAGRIHEVDDTLSSVEKTMANSFPIFRTGASRALPWATAWSRPAHKIAACRSRDGKPPWARWCR